MVATKPAAPHDPVENPVHYTRHGIEPISVIESFGLGPGFHLGNAIKYIARADAKGAALLDLRKALWYIQRAVDNFTATPLEHEMDVDEVLKDWQIGAQLGLVIRYLVEGRWTAAHLMLATEIHHREQMDDG